MAMAIMSKTDRTEVKDLARSIINSQSSEINAMQKLTPAYRTVFNLYVFEEMTHKEIADALGISVGTSKSNLAKAKHNLKKLLRKEHKIL